MASPFTPVVSIFPTTPASVGWPSKNGLALSTSPRRTGCHGPAAAPGRRLDTSAASGPERWTRSTPGAATCCSSLVRLLATAARRRPWPAATVVAGLLLVVLLGEPPVDLRQAAHLRGGAGGDRVDHSASLF